MRTSQPSDTLTEAFEHPTGGVVGIVSDLLRRCPEHGLQLDWQADRCRVRSRGANGSPVLFERPLRKTVFRAMLARVAALCNERNPGSVSPYGGQGELALEGDPSAVFRVEFVNTGEEQTLTIIPAAGRPGM